MLLYNAYAILCLVANSQVGQISENNESNKVHGAHFQVRIRLELEYYRSWYQD